MKHLLFLSLGLVPILSCKRNHVELTTAVEVTGVTEEITKTKVTTVVKRKPSSPSKQKAAHQHQVTIQPILVAKSDGSKVSNEKKNFVQLSTQKIMDQAGIKVIWAEPKIYKSDAMWKGLFHSKLNVEKEIAKSPANMKDKSVIYAIYVNDISTNGKIGGMGLERGNIFFISEWALKRNVKHVVAHELCHNLGLGHENYGAAKAGDRKTGKNVMYGKEPYDIDDIYPSGKKLAQINAEQATIMRKHPAVKEIKAK